MIPLLAPPMPLWAEDAFAPVDDIVWVNRATRIYDVDRREWRKPSAFRTDRLEGPGRMDLTYVLLGPKPPEGKS